MPPSRKRLDLLSVERGIFPTRQIAGSAIMTGALLLNGQKCTKPGTMITIDSRLETIPSWKIAPYVSRGGLKLQHALRVFNTDVAGRICLDIGASTGGFTDCLLQHGAARVYAIDVGYGQIEWKLRQDSRVVVLERINARQLSPEMLYSKDEPKADLAVIDVSFISITKILKPCLSCLDMLNAQIMCLIKPQFEAGKDKVKSRGVVHSAATHLEVLQSSVKYVLKVGLVPTAVTYSPLKGPAGNMEFFLHVQPSGMCISTDDLETAVQTAHTLLA